MEIATDIAREIALKTPLQISENTYRLCFSQPVILNLNLINVSTIPFRKAVINIFVKHLKRMWVRDGMGVKTTSNHMLIALAI